MRHQKHESVREALEHISDAPFHTKHVRIQFIEEIGTAYTDHYDREPFNLNRVDEHGNTLMHIAAQTGNIRIGKLLLRKGANPDHQSKQGQTPGHLLLIIFLTLLAGYSMKKVVEHIRPWALRWLRKINFEFTSL